MTPHHVIPLFEVPAPVAQDEEELEDGLEEEHPEPEAHRGAPAQQGGGTEGLQEVVKGRQ